jgi:periplasmic divalent cation tolerance protein
METEKVVTAVISAPPDTAPEIARQLIARRAAACVQIIPRIRSFYRWEGEVHDDEEALLLVKTVRKRLADIEDILERAHPYEVPEMLVFPASGGLASYLRWVDEET